MTGLADESTSRLDQPDAPSMAIFHRFFAEAEALLGRRDEDLQQLFPYVKRVCLDLEKA